MNVMTARARLALTLAVVCLLLPLLAAAQTTKAQEAPPSQTSKPETTPGPAADGAKLPASVDPNKFDLGAEDVIFIRVWREPDLTGVHVVRPDGKITLPLIGEIAAAGLTPTKLQARITEGLGKLINNPQVTVQVQAVRSKRYYVTGEIFRPGAYPLVVPTTVFEAMTLAGGFREFANKKNITIVRGDKRIKFNYNDVVKGKNLDQNIEIENGDHIIVP
jgi:polysaccharide export outer membrane protein